MLVAATIEERGKVAGHVPGCRVGGGASRGDHLVVGVWLWDAGTKVVAGGQPGAGRLGSDQVSVGHAEGCEDVLAQVAVEGLAGHVLDELAQRGEPVVGVPGAGARLGPDGQGAGGRGPGMSARGRVAFPGRF